MTWLQLVGAILGAALGSTGLVKLIDAVARRRVVQVDVAERVNEMALEWAQQVKADAQAARAEATEARHEAAEARHEMTIARQEATQMGRELRDARRELDLIGGKLVEVLDAIASPEATLDRIRATAVAVRSGWHPRPHAPLGGSDG